LVERSKAEPAVAQKPFLAADKKVSGNVPQMPKLSHIMNLPNLGNLNQAPKTIAQVQKPPFQTKPSAFASRLKAMFQEKELPSGNAELELSAGQEKNGKSPASTKQDVAKSPEQKSEAGGPRPFFPLKENPPVKQQEVKPEPVVLKAPPPVPPKPKTVSLDSFSPPAVPLAPKPLKIPDYPKVGSASIPQKEPAAAKPISGLENLQDLAAMQSKILQLSSADTLAKKIKPLINKNGYFDVIFNIEKSPAYKDYISTGLKLLSEQSNFESLGEETGGYLNRDQFETFADMLAKIQAS
jgi:hypothetical protein